MGILSATGATSVEAPTSGGEAGAGVADEGGADLDGQGQEAANGSPPEMLDGQGDQTGAAQPSRRQRTAAAIDAAIAKHSQALETRFKEQQETYLQKISALEQNQARFLGELEAYRRMPQQQAQPAAPKIDPDALDRQAVEALDKGSFSDYERIKAQAYQARMDQALTAQRELILKEVQQQIPAPMNPFISGLLATHQNVAMAGERGTKAVEIKLNELQLMGAPQGPQTLAQAFKLADDWLASTAKKPTSPSYTAPASSVSGLPTARGGGSANGGAQDAPQLTDAQKRTVATAFGGNVQEYLKWQNPSAWVKKW